MKIQVMTLLCDKHTSDVMESPTYKSNPHLLWQYHGKVPCQEKDCSLPADYKVFIVVELGEYSNESTRV